MVHCYNSINDMVRDLSFDNLSKDNIGDIAKVPNGDKVDIYTFVLADDETKKYQKIVAKFEKSIDLIQK